MTDGFIRVAAATPSIHVADPMHNAQNIISLIKQASNNNTSLIVFPELCITGYTCGDLFLQDTLLNIAKIALMQIAESTSNLNIVAVIGTPIAFNSKLFNCGAVIFNGKILGLVPKTHIPNHSEFYEGRYFSSSLKNTNIKLGDENIPFGNDYIFKCENFTQLSIGVEICEDLWVCNPPSNKLAECGANVICNLSASDEVVGKSDYRRLLISSQSARLNCAYIYANAGTGESSTDMVFCGNNVISENGSILEESDFPSVNDGIIYAELDMLKLECERRKTSASNRVSTSDMQVITFNIAINKLVLTRKFSQLPFVPTEQLARNTRCKEILFLQAAGLATRLKHTNTKKVVIGLSGGLDSTLALIVSVRAFKQLGLNQSDIHTVTMPCFGTTSRTKNNAEILAKAYGVNFSTINLAKSVAQHFEDIGHEATCFDVTFENAQARERTQVLMDLANKLNALVVGTGDLSELALGWATYNGDHMSMYAVNASIPKTLVRHLTAYEAESSPSLLKEVLKDILNTPVSPELLPPKDGDISQKTEELVGPYELHDFFLYYFLRFGYPPTKILRIAALAFSAVYTKDVIAKWLKVFIKRFFSQQFKRSCMPDGPKVGTVTLSPRGDFRMPSDACAEAWLQELECK